MIKYWKSMLPEYKKLITVYLILMVIQPGIMYALGAPTWWVSTILWAIFITAALAADYFVRRKPS